jgi:lipopolysaccharide assembly protein A
MNAFAWLIRIAFFCVVLWLAFRNLTPVQVRLSESIYWDGVPLIVVILTSLLVGVVAGLLAMAPRVYRLRRQLSAAQARGKPNAAPSRPGPATISGVVEVARNAGAVSEFGDGPRPWK